MEQLENQYVTIIVQTYCGLKVIGLIAMEIIQKNQQCVTDAQSNLLSCLPTNCVRK